ncbi:hypothetical protein M758_1G332900 [Ceratodon purpureus]|nr:hypothetical protein M758_1G332900 [Ceratodon purpureus]
MGRTMDVQEDTFEVPETFNTVTELLKQAGGCVATDGGFATQLERHGADINDPLWSALCLITMPDLIRTVHREYLEAGAGVISTASYQATTQGFQSRGLSVKEAEDLLQTSVRNAREERDRFWKEYQMKVHAGTAQAGSYQRALVGASIGSYGAYLADGSEYSGDYGRRWRKLPPLNHPRNPVLMHMLVDPSGNSYKVIVAGSARAGHEHLSKITEVFDSRTSKWTVTQELPGPVFALNEHQTGVCVNGILFCIAFLDAQDSGRGLIAYKVDEGKWLPHLTCRLPNSTNLSIVQVVASNGEVVVFSEIERNPYVGNVEHRIDVLEKVSCTDSGEGLGKWRNVMRETKAGNQAGLQTYPEYTCVPFGDGKLCIFNTIAHTGIVYDVRSGDRVDSLSCPTCSGSGDMGFYSMNPVTFSFEPSFKGNPNLT